MLLQPCDCSDLQSITEHAISSVSSTARAGGLKLLLHGAGTSWQPGRMAAAEPRATCVWGWSSSLTPKPGSCRCRTPCLQAHVSRDWQLLTGIGGAWLLTVCCFSVLCQALG